MAWVDTTRAVLMLLGVPFHAAFVYRGLPWYGPDSAGPVAGAVAGFVHTFRMPAFFAVAGYFAMRAVARKPVGQWTGERARRLLVPFAAGVLVLGPLQLWLVARTTGPAGETFGRWVRLLSQPSLLVFQFWFLTVLFLYGLLLALGVSRFGVDRVWAAFGRAGSWTGASRWRVVFVAVVAGCAVASGWAATVFAGIDTAFGLLDVRQAVIHAPSFVLGAVVAARPDLFDRMTRCSAPAALAWCVAAGALAALEPVAAVPARLLYHAAVPVVGAGMTMVLLTVIRRLLPGPSRVAGYLAAAAMTVYVFHNVLLLGLATVLLPVGWPVSVEYAVLVGGAVAGSLVIHEVLVRLPGLATLFLGQRHRRRARPEAVGAGPD